MVVALRDGRHARRIPLWLKLAYTALVAIVIPVYWVEHGPTNFLWFSDVALIVMLPALWFENALLASMMAVGTLPFEILWLIDFILLGPLGIADYMWGAGDMPIYLRLLSGFHFVMPPVMVFALWRLGYERRALPAQTVLAWVLLPATYLLTERGEENINLIYGPTGPQNVIPPFVYLLMYMIVLPLAVHVPMHFLLKKIFKKGR